MDDKVYIRFKELKRTHTPGRLTRTIENSIVKILSVVTPRANPGFEHLLDKVEYWKIEYSKIENTTWREIGFDKEGISIVAMPLGENYGYWTDNHLTLDDYGCFDPTPVSAEEFDKDWIEFKKKSEK